MSYLGIDITFILWGIKNVPLGLEFLRYALRMRKREITRDSNEKKKKNKKRKILENPHQFQRLSR